VYILDVFLKLMSGHVEHLKVTSSLYEYQLSKKLVVNNA
jgi:hypothetical protein